MSTDLPQETSCGFVRVRNCPKHGLRGVCSPCDTDIWQKILGRYSPGNVFLNVPYPKNYLKRQHLLVSFLVALGLRPVLAGQITNEGIQRICKICELIQYCKLCIHDLTETKLHNMPMELGLSLGLGRRCLILYAGKKHSLEKHFSNVKSITDDIIYYSKKYPNTLLRALLQRWAKSEVLEGIALGRLTAATFDQVIETTLFLNKKINRLWPRYKNYAIILEKIFTAYWAPLPVARKEESKDADG